LLARWRSRAAAKTALSGELLVGHRAALPLGLLLVAFLAGSPVERGAGVVTGVSEIGVCVPGDPAGAAAGTDAGSLPNRSRNQTALP
jgi:hypothetical protein